MRVYLTTYNRPTMLMATLKHLWSFNIEPIIYADGVTHPFRGKEGYWETWDEILKDCEKNPSDLYLFMPEDVLDIDIERIKEIHKGFKGEPYVCNIINDGRHESWVRFQKQQPKNGLEQVGFTDCGFFCSREVLQKTKWRIKQPPATRFNNPNMSSGVGMQLTNIFTTYKIKMYKPTNSLGYHGDHKSEMNTEERKRNPLISK